MSSKKDYSFEKKNALKSAGRTFVFFTIILFLHSCYIFILTEELNPSFYILSLGLCVFFGNSYFLNRQKSIK